MPTPFHDSSPLSSWAEPSIGWLLLPARPPTMVFWSPRVSSIPSRHKHYAALPRAHVRASRVTPVTTHPPIVDTIRIWVAIPTFNWTGRFLGMRGGGFSPVCDGIDGAKDGVIEDPKRCNYDPKADRRVAGECGPVVDLQLGATAMDPSSARSIGGRRSSVRRRKRGRTAMRSH